MNIDKGKVVYLYEDHQAVLEFDLNTDAGDEFISVHSDVEIKDKLRRIKIKLIANVELEIKELYISAETDFTGDEKIFLNGFQSSTDSKEYSPGELINRLSRLIWPATKQYGDYAIYNPNGKRGVLYGYTYSYIRRQKNHIELFGSLTEKSGYTIMEYHSPDKKLYIRKECSGLVICGEYEAFDIVHCQGTEDEAFDGYFAHFNAPAAKAGPGLGWGSGHRYHNSIDRSTIISNLKAFAERRIPIDVFVLEDGYQSAVGDWLIVNGKFPDGMKIMADSIKFSDYKAGLWLAPFICEKNSRLFKEHNDWIQRSSNNKLIKAGFNSYWSGDFYSLDFYHPEVKEYLKQVFDTALNRWGFDMLKLDYLYAAALQPQNGKTRGQIMHEVMEFLRELAGDKLVLSCGVPVGTAFGLTDYCKVGNDISEKWEDDRLYRLNFRERASTVQSIYGAIGRRHLNKRAFYNTSGTFVLGHDNNELNENQKYTLLLMNHLYESLVLASDHIADYDEEQMKLYKSVFPHKSKEQLKSYALGELWITEFKIEGKQYLAIANMGSTHQSYRLEEGFYFSTKTGLIKGGALLELKPYASLCFLRSEGKPYELLGSTKHIFPGSEIAEYKVSGNSIKLTLDKKAIVAGELLIAVPEGFKETEVNGSNIQSEKLEGLQLIRVKL